MSKELSSALNRWTTLLEEGKWQEACRDMYEYGQRMEGFTYILSKIGFYPSSEMLDYFKNLCDAQENKKALDGFFANNI